MAANEQTKEWPLVRFIVPAFPEVNIFTRQAKRMTSLGLVMVATCASKVWGWRVEIIDENNYLGPRDKQGLPDHSALQKEKLALVVGFYCGLTSTMDRVFDLARFYRQQGAFTIAGGWHAHYCPGEALVNGIDVIVHGEGEIIIQLILEALKKGVYFYDIPGISFLEKGIPKNNPPERLEIPNLCDLPYPDFGLLSYARPIKYYPIGRIRGCNMNCEFCSVKGEPRWSDSRHLFEIVNWLVKTRKAKRFFIVDDRSEEDWPGTIEFFRLIASKYQNRLAFTVQVRLEVAKKPELLETMQEAGVRGVCIGYESPIDEDLNAMRKGYSSKKMIEWTKIIRRYFWVHGMFIFGYPARGSSFAAPVPVRERKRRFKRFIRLAKIDSIQVLRPVPIVGTELRRRLEEGGRILPKDLVAWSKYDGSYACFTPDDMTLLELQEIPLQIMRWFYSPFSFFRIPIKTILFPFDYFVRGWPAWHRGWLRDIVKYGGHCLIQRLRTKKDYAEFLDKLRDMETEKF